MTLTGVFTTKVADLWPDVLPLVNRALVEGDGRQGPEDVLTALQAGDMQLWIGLEDDGPGRAGELPESGIAAICITEIIVAPRQKRCCLFLCAGEGVIEALAETLPVIEAWAASEGCAKMELVAPRFEWERVLAPAGYAKAAVLLRKEL